VRGWLGSVEWRSVGLNLKEDERVLAYDRYTKSKIHRIDHYSTVLEHCALALFQHAAPIERSSEAVARGESGVGNGSRLVRRRWRARRDSRREMLRSVASCRSELWFGASARAEQYERPTEQRWAHLFVQ